MQRIQRSIPGKIILAIFIIETVLLTIMGIIYSSRFNREIDERIADKLALPGILMNQRALPYDSVKDFRALTDLVQEKVVEAFIYQRGGMVFFATDPSKEGRSFVDFLVDEEKISLAKDMGKARQISFKDDAGRNYIAATTPLRADGELLGGLYVRISADAIEHKKLGIVLFFCAGAFLTIVLTTCIQAFVVHGLFVPRIIDASAILKRYAGGDFTARIGRIGPPDQLGELMRQVNSLLEKIEEYTGKLHALNMAGGIFARVEEKDEVFLVAAETVERHLRVQALKNGDTDRRCIFSLPVHGDQRQIVQFSDGAGDRQLSPAEASFVNALSGLMESALHRIEAFRKITEAEEKYRYLFVSALEGIFRADPKGLPKEVNPALAAMLGYDSVEGLIGSVTEISERFADPGKRRKMRLALMQDGKFQDFEVVLRRKDGSTFSASMSAHLVRDKKGAVQAIEGRVIDISERQLREKEKQEQLAADAVTRAKLLLVEDLEQKNKQLNEALDELKSMQLQLIQSEKMAAVGMTASGVAHDLNNILAGVISYPELLLATMPAGSQYRKPLEAILASGRRAAAVVADLLTLARGSARVRQSVRLHALIEEYLQSVEFLTLMREYPKVQVTAIDEAGEAMIYCSPVHLQKVIMNLVMNAVEAVAPLGGSVTLLTRIQPAVGNPDEEGKDGHVVLEVCDNGPGILPENQKHIFEPFYTRKVMGKKGTGLGLTVVWNVVREHGGFIELDSGSLGSTFRVVLPVDRDLLPVGSQSDEEADLRGKGRILVVDDEPLQRDIAGKMLTIFGYEVDTVSSGEEAIAYLRRHNVDLVVLDMLMPPGINGLQTYIEIIAIHPGQKALIVSGFSESSDVKEAMRLGVGGFVKKPYTMKQIARAIRDELARRSDVRRSNN
jgi:PAS domain S-box-containing protein